MKILVTGVNGQLGHDVMNELARRGIEGVGTDVDNMDVTDAAACQRVIKEVGPDAVMHQKHRGSVQGTGHSHDVHQHGLRV